MNFRGIGGQASASSFRLAEIPPRVSRWGSRGCELGGGRLTQSTRNFKRFCCHLHSRYFIFGLTPLVNDFLSFPVLVNDFFGRLSPPCPVQRGRGGSDQEPHTSGRERWWGGPCIPSKLVSRRPEVFAFFGQGTRPSAFKGAFSHERE